MKIIVDAMGGDNAPGEIVQGACMAAEEFGVEVTLVGRGEEILKALSSKGVSTLPKGVEIANAEQVVDMHDNPTAVIREKKDSSLVVGLKLLAEGKGDAFVSAGNTGAVLTAATLIVKRIKGVRRAALAPVIPTANGGALLIDCGANTECGPDYLLQFALMGRIYAEKIMGRKNPSIGLLNNGTEETKGCQLQKDAYVLLKRAHEDGQLNFHGNVEGRDAPLGAVDVIVSDGFTGNIFLKCLEGVGIFFSNELKAIFKKNLISKLAALMVMKGVKAFKQKMDYKEVGGTVLLGIAKPVFKAHGSADAYTFRSAMKQAITIASTGIEADIAEAVAGLRGAEDA